MYQSRSHHALKRAFCQYTAYPCLCFKIDLSYQYVSKKAENIETEHLVNDGEGQRGDGDETVLAFIDPGNDLEMAKLT